MSIAKPQTTSLIDTLNQGFMAINRRLWVIVIPVLLNAYVWYGAQVSFQPVIDNLVTLMQSTPALTEGDSNQAVYDTWRTLGQYDITQHFDRLELVPRMTLYMVESVPGGLPFPERVLPLLNNDRVIFKIANGSVAALLFLAVNMLLLPVGAAFLTMLAGAVRGDATHLRESVRRFAMVLVSILGYAAILLAGAIVIGLPLVVIGGLFLVAVPALGAFIVLLLLVAFFWLGIYIGFAPEGIALNQLDPLQAIRTSFMLVRRNFWATVVLLLISFVITVGLGVIWGMLVNNTFGLVAAIVGSSYIGSGLIAARMVFYRERVI